jgi:hypothetical protein
LEPERLVTSPEVKDAIAQVEAASSFTPKKELVSHFGEERLETKPDGTWNIHLKTPKELAEFDEMDRPRARLETRQAQEAFARVPVVLLRASNGKTWEVPELVADELCQSPMGIALGVRIVPRLRKKHGLYAVGPNGVRRA